MRVVSLWRKLEFRQQLVVTLIAGITVLALCTSISITSIANRSVKSQMVQQAIYLTELIARHSRLALLYESGTSAAETARVALEFPDVVGVSIATENGKLLYRQGEQVDTVPGGSDMEQARLVEENSAHLIFVAPVVTQNLDASLWAVDPDSTTEVKERIGYVRLVFSKASLQETQAGILWGNIGVSALVALVLLAVVLLLARHITVPLKALSRVMNRAQRGEMNLRTSPSGPRDIVSMQRSFNTMMEAIENRDRELRQARDVALETAEVKSRFAANVSHELRTPMNSVLGMLDLLSHLDLASKQQEYVETARSSAQSLLGLIDDILSYVHADSGEIAIDRTDTDVVEMLEEVVNLLSTQALRKKVDLGYRVAPGVRYLEIDAQRVKQILVNLVSNAIKFTEAGEISIDVRVEGHPGDCRLIIAVRDTGVGIRPANLDRIFEAFTQEDATTTRRYGGTGLGLAICRQYASLMEGTIQVESELYYGSAFTLTLPVATASGNDDSSVDGGLLKGQRMLVADDAAVVRNFIASWLEAHGADVVTAGDAVELISQLNSVDQEGKEFHYLFVDEEIPGLPLAELLKLVAEHHSSRDAVVVALVNPWAAESEASLQGCHFLEKPLLRGKLANLVLTSPGTEASVPDRSPPLERFAIRVLVVDDNRANRLVAGGMLEQFGCECDYVQDGREALTWVARHNCDLVLMDCNMPVMDGYESTRLIRSEANIPETLPVIGMTANNSAEEKSRCLEAGMNDLLVKPLTLRAVGWLLAQYFPRVQGQRHPDGGAPGVDADTFYQLRDSLGDVFPAVVEAFIDDLPMYLDSLGDALSQGDHQQVYELAHTVKGSATSVGGTRVSERAKRLETMGREHDLRGADAVFSRLETDADALCRDLRDYLQRGTREKGQGSDTGLEPAVVLVADDDRSVRLSFANALRSEGFRIVEATNGQGVLAICARAMPDILLVDAIMPELNGFETCRRVRRMYQGSDVPILMVTALEDEHSIARAFDAGATDYVTKPVNFSVLRQRVMRLLQTSRVERHVRELAYRDSLTGLPNRAHFNQQLRHRVYRAGLNRRQLAVLFLDLNRFKMINDSLGHDAGDLVLKAAADRIVRCLGPRDLVARLGGDEFTVIIEDVASPEPVERLCEEIGEVLQRPFDFLDERIFVSASIGVALFPRDGRELKSLIKHADTAMFQAKEAGSGYCFYRAGMEDEITEQLRSEREFRTAFENGEIFLHYQPQVDLQTLEVVGFEGLARWAHPERGILSAREFIDTVEVSGMTGELMQLALDRGCRQLQEWSREDFAIRVAINVSGGDFQEGNLRDQLGALAERYRFPLDMLEIEITETTLVDHPELVQSELSLLREQGLSIAIDDFGSGFSSLNYLKRFSVDVLKIDREFVRDCHLNSDDKAIITGIITLAKSLDLLVVAEGVEQAEQAEFLRQAGCDVAQGYYFARPASIEEIQRDIDDGTLKVRRRQS